MVRYPLPRRKPPGKRPMTIAAGFKCDTGVLLCTDSLMSTDQSGYTDRKMEPICGTDYIAIFAITGGPAFCFGSIRKCESSLNRYGAPDRSIEELADEIAGVWYEEYCKGLPVHAYDSVICALWSRRDGMTELYVSNEGSFTVVPRGFFCAGAGKFTADYVIGAEGGFGVLTPELRSAAAAFRQMFYDQKGAFTTKRFEESLKGARFRYQKVLDVLAEKPSYDTLTRTLGALRELEKPKGPR